MRKLSFLFLFVLGLVFSINPPQPASADNYSPQFGTGMSFGTSSQTIGGVSGACFAAGVTSYNIAPNLVIDCAGNVGVKSITCSGTPCGSGGGGGAAKFSLPLVMAPAGEGLGEPGSIFSSSIVPPNLVTPAVTQFSISCYVINNNTSTLSVTDLTTNTTVFTTSVIPGLGNAGPGQPGNFYTQTLSSIALTPGDVLQLSPNDDGSSAFSGCSAFLYGTAS